MKTNRRWLNDNTNHRLTRTQEKHGFNMEGMLIDFPLMPGSLIFDIGGWHGYWTLAMMDCYNCNSFIFEPVQSSVDKCREMFRGNEKVKIFDFGLTNQDRDQTIYIPVKPKADLSNASSTINHFNDSEKHKVQMKDVVSFCENEKINQIDVMKINIEGDEYDLLTRVIDAGLHNNINFILVQFHDFIKDGRIRRDEIVERLSSTHNNVYNYDMVWELWRLK